MRPIDADELVKELTRLKWECQMVYSSFDNVDASLTLIDQCLENATENSQITVDGYKLC